MSLVIKSPLIIEEQSLSYPLNGGVSEHNSSDLGGIDQAEAEVAHIRLINHESALTTHESLEANIVTQQPLLEAKYFESESFKQRLAEVERLAEEKAYAEGFRKGEAEAKLKYSEGVNLFNQMIQSGQSSISNILDDSKGLIGEIVFQSVCKILGDQLVTQEACLSVIAKVISSVKREEIISVSVSLEDYSQLQMLKEKNSTDFNKTFYDLILLPDSSIKQGGCLLKLKDGLVNGTLDVQLKNYAHSLHEYMLRIS